VPAGNVRVNDTNNKVGPVAGVVGVGALLVMQADD
jgi:hypothetical protein